MTVTPNAASRQESTVTPNAPSISQATVTPNAAVTATNIHYEMPVEVFAAFLDVRMKYSCGLYADDTVSLDEAQRAKLDWVLTANLGLAAGQRLLDVGCGWGSLTLYAAEQGCHVVGVTPSRPQREHILRQAAARGLADRVTVRLGRFTSLDLDGESFDGVSMLGSIVHMPDRFEVLSRAYQRLRTHGRLYLSESCFRNRKTFERFRTSPGFQYVGEEIFGFGEMAPLAELIAAAEEAGFSLVKLSDLTAHYRRTLADWAVNAERSRAAIEAAVPGATDRLLRYFEIGETGFGYTVKHYAFAAEKSRMGTLLL